MSKHLVVISVDAMVYEDLNDLAVMPNIGRLLKKGSVVKRVKTIYPSLTHPVHATLITGCTAGTTGITNNLTFETTDDPEWFNDIGQIKCETLLHAAHKAGLTTAACRWPVTAKSHDVTDYLVPEVMDHEIAAEPDQAKLYKKICTPQVYEDIVCHYTDMLDISQRHPTYDAFEMVCAAEILKKYKPSLLLTHPGYVDHCRHVSGLFSKQVTEALAVTDRWIGMLLQAAEEAGIAEETDFAVISDHGQMEMSRTVGLNVLFREKGLIRCDDSGRVTDWELFSVESGLSCHIFVRRKEREAEFLQWLNELSRTGLYGFTEVLTKEECLERYGLKGEFSFVLEGDGYTEFSNRLSGKIAEAIPDAGSGSHRASHGHMPEKGPQPPMIVCGPSFKENVVLETASILNEAPTFAKVLGVELKQAEGQAIDELLK